MVGLCAVFPSFANDRWVFVAADAGGEPVKFHFVDRLTFIGGENPIFWRKTEEAGCLTGDITFCRQVRAKMKILCKEKQFALIALVETNSDGNVVGNFDYSKKLDFSSVPPETVVELITNFVCYKQAEIINN